MSTKNTLLLEKHNKTTTYQVSSDDELKYQVCEWVRLWSDIFRKQPELARRAAKDAEIYERARAKSKGGC